MKKPSTPCTTTPIHSRQEHAAQQQLLAEHIVEGKAQDEPDTTAWFAIRIDESTYGIFDVFPGEQGRQAHLDGPIAAALMQQADELLAAPPDIKPIDVLAATL